MEDKNNIIQVSFHRNIHHEIWIEKAVSLVPSLLQFNIKEKQLYKFSLKLDASTAKLLILAVVSNSHISVFLHVQKADSTNENKRSRMLQIKISNTKMDKRKSSGEERLNSFISLSEHSSIYTFGLKRHNWNAARTHIDQIGQSHVHGTKRIFF